MEQLLTPEMIAGGLGLGGLGLVLLRLAIRIGELVGEVKKAVVWMSKAAESFSAHVVEEKRHHEVLEEQNEYLIKQQSAQIELLIAIANATRGVPEKVEASDVTPVTSIPIRREDKRPRVRRVSGPHPVVND